MATRRAAAAGRTVRQRAGDDAESAAAAHMTSAGCRLLDRNARYPDGEIDLVMRDGDVVVFVEVRMRRSALYGGAGASVDAPKQRRLLRAAQRWLKQHHGERWPACRFDVVAIDGNGTIDWIKQAFSA